MAARQQEHPIVIEDQDLARHFVRLLRTRDMKLRPLGTFVAEIASYAIRRSYGSDIENDWYIGGYVLPGNVPESDLQIEGATISGRNKLALPRPVTAPPCALVRAGARGGVTKAPSSYAYGSYGYPA
jgi:hypothetical protein